MAIVVPLLNEIKALPTLLVALCRLGADEIILVDGGSSDGSYQWLENTLANKFENNIRLISSEAGRAAQMNQGAKVAKSDILLFVHADTVLPDAALTEVDGVQWGRFDIMFHDNLNPALPSLKLIAFMINLRSRLSGVATGDQSIFVRRALFDQVGGYQNIPIMEDVALSKSLRKLSRPYCSRLKVSTSARRWRQKGVWRTVFLMWGLRLAYFVGISPKGLHQAYREIR